MEAIEKAIRLKAELDSLRPLDKEQDGRIMQKFRLDWNYHSNHLEGNSLTYGETKALILFGITAQGKPLRDHIETTGHNEAINLVIDVVKGGRPLTENFIREIHELLLKEPYEVDAVTKEGLATRKTVIPGKYKTQPNHVRTSTGEIFYFATPEETPAKMHDLLNWYKEKNEKKDLDPILLAAEFHYKFIRIHPFDDGNGRTARILMNFILMQYDYPPVIIKTGDKENYYAVLRLADAEQIEPFIEYIATNLVRSLEIMLNGAKGLNIEEPDDIDKEIALLEQRLMGVGKKIIASKNKENILIIYNNSFVELFKLFVSISEKFNRFYVENSFHYSIDNYIISNRYIALEQMKKQITDNTSIITLSYDFTGFGQRGLNEFNYQSLIQFNFKKTAYSVIALKDGMSIEKFYDEQLTDSEIKELVNAEAKKHTAFIEAKIKEKENKKIEPKG